MSQHVDPTNSRSGCASSGDEQQVEEIARAFVDRVLRGESLSIDEYCDQHTEHADELRMIIPAMIAVESLKPPSDEGEFFGIEPANQTRTAPKFVGDYRILRELGRGGMGIVYEAEQQSLDRHVALKVMTKSAITSETSTQRFESEARAAARLHHTNIVPVFDVGTDGDTLFYAMQLIQGQSLDLVINDLKRFRRGATDAPDPMEGLIATSIVRGSIDEARHQTTTIVDGSAVAADFSSTQSTSSAVLPGKSDLSSASSNRTAYFRSVAQIGIQTADALSYAHARGIIHRDIKPSNLLLDGNGIVWITDFGLAKSVDSDLTQTGDVPGTLRYMSPERFSGVCSVESDVYALGLTLYEMLVLEPAFSAADQLNLINKIQKTDPVAPRTLDSGIPRDLETIVLKSIEKEASHRYRSARELSADLQRFINDEPIRGRRTYLHERFIRWSRNNRLLTTSLVSLGCLLIMATVASLIAATRFSTLEAQATRSLHSEIAARRLADKERDLANLSRTRADQKADEAREANYFSQVALAHHEWKNANPHRARELLNACPEEHRNWEWRYLDYLLKTSSVAKLKFSPGEHLSVGFVPGGTKLLIPDDNRVVVYDMSEGKVIDTLGTYADKVSSIAVSDNGRWIATTSNNKVDLWDAKTFKHEQTFLTPFGIGSSRQSLALSKDGSIIAVRSRVTGEIYCWDRKSLRLLCTIETKTRSYCNIVIHPDGAHLFAHYRDGWTAYEIESGDKMIDRKSKHNLMRCLALSPDGRLLATGGNELDPIQIWDAESGERLSRLRGHTGLTNELCFHPDGKRLLSANTDGTIRIWDIEASSELSVLRGHDRYIQSACFSSNGQHVVSRDKIGEVRLWDVRRDLYPTFTAHQRGVKDLRFINDSMHFVSAAGDGSLRYWDLKNEVERKTVSKLGHTPKMVVSPDRKHIATINYNDLIRVWRVEADEPTFVVPPEENGKHPRSWCLQFTPDSQSLASTSNTGVVKFYDVHSGRVTKTFAGPPVPIGAMAFHPRGHLLATSQEYGVVLRNTDTGIIEHRLDDVSFGGRSLTFDPQGKVLLGTGFPGDLVCWDVEQKKSRFKIRAHALMGQDIAFSPDGTRFATVGNDGYAKIWASDTGRQTLMLKMKSTLGRGIDFSDDGTVLAAGNEKGGISFWYTQDHRPSANGAFRFPR